MTDVGTTLMEKLSEVVPPGFFGTAGLKVCCTMPAAVAAFATQVNTALLPAFASSLKVLRSNRYIFQNVTDLCSKHGPAPSWGSKLSKDISKRRQGRVHMTSSPNLLPLSKGKNGNTHTLSRHEGEPLLWTSVPTATENTQPGSKLTCCNSELA